MISFFECESLIFKLFFSRTFIILSVVPFSVIPKSSLAWVIITMPIPTASPWLTVSKFHNFSIAWPQVCPKLRSALSPCSFSSFSTTWRFILTHSVIISVILSLALPLSRSSKSEDDLIHPYLITSPIPSLKKCSLKVESTFGSIITIDG